MQSNEIYQKITENIIQQFQIFKKGEINNQIFNENLILNLSSMCKFLKDKETLNNSASFGFYGERKAAIFISLINNNGSTAKYKLQPNCGSN